MDTVTEVCHERLLKEWKNPLNLDTTVHQLLGETAEDFIKRRLETKWTNFHQYIASGKKKAYFQYRCLRSRKPTVKSHRRVGCTAYISYKILTCPTLGDVVLERISQTHTGHDPYSDANKHTLTVCATLEKKILKWIDMEVVPDIMLEKAYEWAQKNGHTDVNDARYYVTPTDIKNIRKKYLRSRQLDDDDTRSLHLLLTEQRPEDVLLYQQYIHEEQPLILILQTEEMKADLASSTSKMVFMDATNSVNKYGYPLWSLIVTNKFGRGVPVAHIITSAEDQDNLEVALKVLKRKGLNPSAFMLDKDYREISAVKEVFPKALVLLCFFHVLQAVHRWLISKNSSLCGTGFGQKRNDVIHFFAKLKRCTSEREYDASYEEFKEVFADHEDLLRYFKNNWYKIGEMWANYGRRFNHGNADTNNLAERFFLRLKYQFLSRRRNRRLDQLVTILLTRANNYMTILHNLREVGRIVDAKVAQAFKPAAAADRMVMKGWSDKVVRIGDGNYIVPSEFDVDNAYCVNIPDCSCTCEESLKSSMCKHVHVVRKLQQQDHLRFGSLEVDLAAGCEFLRPHRNIWHVAEDGRLCVNMLDTNDTIHASMSECSCVAFSYFADCSHIRLASSVLEAIQHFQQHEPVIVHHSDIEEEQQPEPTNGQEDPIQQMHDGENMPQEVAQKNESLLMLKALVNHYDSTQTVPDTSSKILIKKLHDKVFMRDVGDKKRKHPPLFPNRIKRIKSIEQRNAKKVPPLLESNPETMLDHSMVQSTRKQKKEKSKSSFRVTNKHVVVRKSTKPSMKKIVERNKGQTGQVTLAKMKLNIVAADELKRKGSPPPHDTPLEVSYFSELMYKLRILSRDTLEKLSDDEIIANLKEYFKKKFNRKKLVPL